MRTEILCVNKDVDGTYALYINNENLLHFLFGYFSEGIKLEMSSNNPKWEEIAEYATNCQRIEEVLHEQR